jgi:hypothetical protein
VAACCKGACTLTHLRARRNCNCAGGPLDHANNWPFRGGKHTYWEGGLRTESFIWSPLLRLPPRAPGSPVQLQPKYSGIMHIADW